MINEKNDELYQMIHGKKDSEYAIWEATKIELARKLYIRRLSVIDTNQNILNYFERTECCPDAQCSYKSWDGFKCDFCKGRIEDICLSCESGYSKRALKLRRNYYPKAKKKYVI